jgi:RNase H-fold protein (predicted Holliday junction resolvase)
VKLLVAVALLVIVAGFVGAQLQQRTDRSQNAVEQQALIDKFPIARADERAKVMKEYAAISAERDKREAAQTQAMADLKQQMAEMHDLNAYTLRFLGDRAKINDMRNAAMLKQTAAATQAAVTVQRTAEQIDQKVNVAVVKADEAAKTAKAVDKKLETAVQPPQSAKPWIGNQR